MDTVLEVKNLRRTFYKGKTLLTAVDGVSFQLKKGEILGIVGESGCGKSTTVKMITKLLRPEGGEIFLKGKDITNIWGRKTKEIYKEVQMIFQLPLESFNPRKTLGSSIMEGMINNGMPKKEAVSKATELLGLCGLEGEYMNRFPHQVSGGQCQRAAIARAIALEPEILICDEATSALDVTVQRQVLDLLKCLQREKGMSYLFICHDLALVQQFCDRVIVMKDGRIVEEGTPDEVIKHPKEEYTKILIESVFQRRG